MAYTNQEYYDMLMALGECHGQYHAAARRYAELYPNRARHPSARVILRAAQRLYETGSVLVNKHDGGRDREARNLRNTEAVLRAFEQNPELSIRIVAREHNLSRVTVHRILQEEKMDVCLAWFGYCIMSHFLKSVSGFNCALHYITFLRISSGISDMGEILMEDTNIELTALRAEVEKLRQLLELQPSGPSVPSEQPMPPAQGPAATQPPGPAAPGPAATQPLTEPTAPQEK
ncbi:PREDICTED: uncharacterized protein LOC108759830, partial [Trachymyrmex cornetzi]|uniref:uncharacterized protein LOC108759830 n=1 Tax=Trachymyrmex cornetzi TaxID=471704 RepID=UPI00084F0609